MVGIYKITDLTNNLVYIGQSNNIQRRKIEHFNNNRYSVSKIDQAILNKGQENFDFEILEECLEEELDEREQYWINYYDSFYNGYNMTKGGQGQYCGNPKIEAADVKLIRQAYANHQNWFNVYQQYKDKITVDGFKHIWQGNRWKSIMPEVYTDENKKYYQDQGRFKSGEQHNYSRLSDEQVINIRKRYVHETAESIWKDFSDIYSLGSFKQVLQGIKYSHLPIYKKQQKKWINIEDYNEFNECN